MQSARRRYKTNSAMKCLHPMHVACTLHKPCTTRRSPSFKSKTIEGSNVLFTPLFARTLQLCLSYGRKTLLISRHMSWLVWFTADGRTSAAASQLSQFSPVSQSVSVNPLPFTDSRSPDPIKSPVGSIPPQKYVMRHCAHVHWGDQLNSIVMSIICKCV